MKKKKTGLKITHKKEPKKETKPRPLDSTDEMVNAIHDELAQIADILEAEFAKPLSDEEEIDTERTSDKPKNC